LSFGLGLWEDVFTHAHSGHFIFFGMISTLFREATSVLNIRACLDRGLANRA
jgi:hypothetical protein